MSVDKFPTGTEPVPHGDNASSLQADTSALNLKTDTRQANWRRANPEKYEAHLAVGRALKTGELVKGVCEVCGDPAVDAHHDDYTKPLEVRWLCRQHHIRLHGGGEDMFPWEAE